MEGTSGTPKINQSKTIAGHNCIERLLSVPDLVRKDIELLFVPVMEIFIKILDNTGTPGYARQLDDGMF